MGGTELGLTTSGGYSATGSREWLDAVKGRGNPASLGANQTDYATWGGMITFDSRAKWNFGSGQPGAGQYDFESVALHEMMHVFGFGLGEPAFVRNVIADTFLGPAVVAANGGRGVATGGHPADHFADGTNYHGDEDPMQPSLLPGVKRHLTPLDYAALKDIGWQVSGVDAGGPAIAAAPGAFTATVAGGYAALTAAPTTTAPARFALGTTNAAIVYGQFGEVVRTVMPFGAGYSAGVRVTSADFNRDGVADLVAATGPGVSNAIGVFDGTTGRQFTFLQPFEAGFAGGLNVASGDLTGDGVPDLVVTPDLSGGPVVVVYDGAALALGQTVQVSRFFGLDDPSFRGGIRPAIGDLNGDGSPDLALAAGFGGGPRVALYDGRTVVGGTPSKLTGDFFAFEPALRNGVNLAVVDGNLVVGAGPGGGPRVTAFDGPNLLAGRLVARSDAFVGNVNDRNGARVAAVDLDNSGQPDLLTSVGNQVFAKPQVGASPALTVTVADPLAGGNTFLAIG
jgi:hypothetical protein